MDTLYTKSGTVYIGTVQRINDDDGMDIDGRAVTRTCSNNIVAVLAKDQELMSQNDTLLFPSYATMDMKK